MSVEMSLDPGETLVELSYKDYYRIYCDLTPEKANDYRLVEQHKVVLGILQRWCRLNCKSKFRYVVLWSTTTSKEGFAFTDVGDALLFKLTWS